MPFGDHLQVDLGFTSTIQPDPFTCRLWYSVGGSSPQVGTMDTYANEIMEFFATEVAAVLPAGTLFGNLRCRWQLDDNEHFAWSSNAAVAGGVTASESLPETDSVIIRKYTGDSAPNRRGRMFIPFVPETFQNYGRLTAGAITAYQALIAQFKLPPTGDSIDGDGIVLTPKQPDFKTTSLHDVLTWALVLDVHTRRDRKTPRRSIITGA